MKQVNKLSFSGEEIFCGIDVHAKSWTVSIRDRFTEYHVFSQPPIPAVLVNHIKNNFPNATYNIVYEAGFCGFSYQRYFQKEGINCIVVNAADVPTSDKEKRTKTDVVDCRKLSKCLSERSIKGIFVPDIRQQSDRTLVRTYRQLIRDQTAYKNRIKGWLYIMALYYLKI